MNRLSTAAPTPRVTAAGNTRQYVSARPRENAAASVSSAPRNTRSRADNLYMIWDALRRGQREGDVRVSKCAAQFSAAGCGDHNILPSVHFISGGWSVSAEGQLV